jgi:thiol-disulfide isomerase/thioredoxin
MKSGFILLFLLFCSLSFGQKLKFKVNNQKDTTVHLIKYFGTKKFYADTAEMKNGVVEFDGSKQSSGILGLLMPGQRYFEFIYNDEDIDLETEGPDYAGNLVVHKSAENNVFIPYIRFIGSQKSKMGRLGQERGALSKTDPKFTALTEEIKSVNAGVQAYQENIIAENDGMLVAKIVKMSTEVDIPEAPVDENGVITDSNFRFLFYRNHYWDNVDLTDDALVNNPIFHNKLEYFFGQKMMVQHWDTVAKYAFHFCDQLNPKSKMFEYSVGWITSSFGKSKIMGMDKVYLEMLNRYYCTDNLDGSSPAFWVGEDKFEDLCDNLKNKLRLTIGSVPFNLKLRDTTDVNWVDFYSLTSDYTILYFWDPECGHCKKTTPKLETLYREKFKARNVEIFSVGKAIGEDFDKWKKFIQDNNLTFINAAVTDRLYNTAKDTPEKLVELYPGEPNKPTTLESLNYQNTYDIFSTPKVFLLDKDKKIIAKSISISQLEDMIDRLQGKEDLPKLFPPDPEEDAQMQKKE